MQKWILFAPRAMGAVHVCLLHSPGLFCRFRISVCVGMGVGCGGSGSRESWLFLGEGVKFTIFLWVGGWGVVRRKLGGGGAGGGVL